MGRLEKIVVLTVLFLVAVILAISLNQSGDKKGAGGPLASNENKKSETSGTPGASVTPTTLAQPNGGTSTAPAGDPKSAPQVNPGLISTNITPGASPTPIGTTTPPPPINKPADVPTKIDGPASIVTPPTAPGSMLKTHVGLTESLFNDLYLYTWQTGDTFAALAAKYYGSEKLAVRLRTENSGREESSLKPGDKIFVPNVEAPTPAASTKSGAVADPNAPVESKKTSTEDGYYTVQKGDLLGTISKKVYGTTKKWQKIYDANRDLLKDPNALKVGMKLRIPE